MTKKNNTQESPTKKCRVLEYSQQLEYMEKNGIPTDKDKLEKYVKKQFPNASEYLIILHDKDGDKDGNPVKPHFHIFLYFINPKSASFVAKKFNDQDNRVQLWHKKHKEKQSDLNSWNCAISYACHLTSKARKENKHQYSPDEARTSIKNYAEVLEEIEKEVSEKVDKLNEKARMIALTNVSKITDLLDGYRDGLLSYEDIMQHTTASQRTPSFMSHLRSVTKEILDEKYKIFEKEMASKNEPIKVRWVVGKTGTGKSSFSRDYAKNVLGVTPYIAQNAKSTFDDYSQEKCIIFEEFGPNEIPLKEMLILLDNWAYDKRATARYRHRTLTPTKGFIINSRLSISEFWKAIKDPEKGSVSQMYRRISEIYLFEDKEFTQLYCENLTIDECEQFLNEHYDEILNPDDVNEEFAKLTASNDHETRIAVLLESDSVYENIYTKDQRAENLFAHQKEHLHQDLSKLKGHSKGVEKNE